MAHIVEFSVDGLAGRKEPYAKKLNRDVNIFFGLNGAGKTSLLKILVSAMRGNSSILINVPFQKATVVMYSVKYARDITFTIEKPAPKSKKQASTFTSIIASVKSMLVRKPGETAAFNWQISPVRTDGPTRWEHRYLSTTRLLSGLARPRGGEAPRANVDYEDTINSLTESELLSQWSEYFGEVQADVRRIQESGLAEVLKTVLGNAEVKEVDNLSWENAYELAESFLKRQGGKGTQETKEQFKSRYMTNPILPRVISHINNIERSATGVLAPRDGLERLLNKLFFRKTLKLATTSIEVETQDHEKIQIAHLSSGEKQVLYILIQALKSGSSSLLIDEPEISMHIEWQRTLVPAMMALNPDMQLIIATHSPEIMADISESKIFNL